MNIITEPMRKSLLDVVQCNLRVAGRKTYVTRVVYFGDYRGAYEVLSKKMENIISYLRADYDMPVTGLFLVYPTYYVHVLETWEDIIYKHYELMYVAENDECEFGKAIPLSSYHHVHQRFFSEWYHMYTISPTLLGTLEDYTLEHIQKQVSNCLTKVYTLCEYIANTMREKSIDARDVLRDLGGKAARYLPESTILEFLLHVESPVLETVQDRLRMYSDVSPSEFWDDNNVWPPPCSLMPTEVFDERGHRMTSSFEHREVNLEEIGDHPRIVRMEERSVSRTK